MTAGVAAMEAYPTAEVARINALGERLRQGLSAALTAAGVTAAVTGYGSFVGLHLGADEVRTYRDAASGDKALARLLHLALLLEGIYVAPRLMMCVSTAMDEEIIDEVLAGFRRAVAAIRPAIAG
jgi:glutamate-1-semialdehyde 2,1-aminomutase